MWWLPLILTLPYFLSLLIIRRYLSGIIRFEPPGNEKLFVSVVVACKNEERALPVLLECLKNQAYPKGSFEVIIVDDNSTDKTRLKAESYESSLNLRILPSSGKGKKQALRSGIIEAKGNLILATDADCSVSPGWINTIVSFYISYKADMIICPVMLEEGKGFFGHFQELEFLSLQGITAGTAAAGMATMCNGANLAFTRESYMESVKDLRFDIPTGDDVFLLHGMKNKGRKILWLESREATVITGQADRIRSFLKQRKRWASKSTAYRDSISIFLGISALLMNMVQAFLMIAAIMKPEFLPVFTAVFLVKSIPDYLILLNTTRRYEKTTLMRWFLPSQIVYPFYVLIVTVFALSSPFRKGT